MKFGSPLAIVMLLAAGWLAGCGTIQPRYKPKLPGDLRNEQPDSLLAVTLETTTPKVRIGEEIFLTVRIRNIGDHGVWLPSQPIVLLSWIYPDGVRNNFLPNLPEEQYFERPNAIWLAPGEQIKQRVPVRTYYFMRAGITEFRALLHVGRNTNPDLSPCWRGELQSNAYGIIVEKGDRFRIGASF